VQSGAGVHPVSYLVDTGVPYVEVKPPGRDVDYTRRSSERMRMSGAMYITCPHIHLCLLDVDRDSSTLIFGLVTVSVNV
jgi:hypothetical protein